MESRNSDIIEVIRLSNALKAACDRLLEPHRSRFDKPEKVISIADRFVSGSRMPAGLSKAEQMQLGEELAMRGFIKSRKRIGTKRPVVWVLPSEEPRK